MGMQKARGTCPGNATPLGVGSLLGWLFLPVTHLSASPLLCLPPVSRPGLVGAETGSHLPLLSSLLPSSRRGLRQPVPGAPWCVCVLPPAHGYLYWNQPKLGWQLLPPAPPLLPPLGWPHSRWCTWGQETAAVPGWAQAGPRSYRCMHTLTCAGGPPFPGPVLRGDWCPQCTCTGYWE